MSQNNIKPEFLFETSWEVCNKVGGIYTVLSSKYPSVKGQMGNRYIFIGPDVWKETRENPDFIEDRSLYHEWVGQAEKEDLRVRIGRWNIPGKPVAILVDFTTFFSFKDKIFAKFWETYHLDSLTGGWDYIEPSLFGYATGKVIESFCNFYLPAGEKAIAHFHEWMTGAGILYLKEYAPHIATVFTTHATILGRSMAGNNLPLYSQLGEFNPEEMAKKTGIVAKFSLEKNASVHADSFTTVSEITARECFHFFDREVDVITPNGFSSFDTNAEEYIKRKSTSRDKILEVASAVYNQKLDDDTLILMTSGRYEFINKGLDAFIDALGKLNEEKNLNRKVLAIIAVPGNHSGPRKEVIERIKSPDFSHPLSNEYLTHNLYDRYHDPVINRILENNLNNGSESQVKMLFVPVYLDGHDGIFELEYYDFLAGCDLTAFPSFYEPWGYTPLESIAFGIPTITTTLAGFGSWVKGAYKTPQQSVSVIERTEGNYDIFVSKISDQITHFANCAQDDYQKSKSESLEIAAKLQWTNLAEQYSEAYKLAIEKSSNRPEKLHRRAATEYLLKGSGIQDQPDWKKMFVKTQIPDELEPLKEMSLNMWWCWNYEAIELFESIEPELWVSTERNPVSLLNKLSYEHLQDLKSDEAFMEKMRNVYKTYTTYMADKENAPEGHVGYFSMEFGLHESVKIYSGGLGILAGDYLKEASDSNKRMTGIGLMYRYGYFAQSISIFGDQIAESKPQKYTDLPLQPVRNENDEWVRIGIALPGRTLYAKVWKLQIGRIDLYLLDTDIEENTMEDRAITHHLYGGDWNNRFKQELLLGVGGVRLLYALNIKPDVYHLNEGHAAFAGLERLRHLVEDRGMSFAAAREVIRSSSLFTTHTPVPAGHDTFSEDILRTYIPHYADRLNISWDDFMNLGRYHKNKPDEKFSMSVLAANLSQEMNGVSKIHGRVSRDMFAGLYPGYFADELHIGYVTNGVHYASWAASNWQQFHDSKLGKELKNDQSNPGIWKKIHTISDATIWKQRLKARKEFLDFLRTKMQDDLQSRQESPQVIYQTIDGIIDDALYIGFARRFATYKRAHLLFTNIDRLEKLLSVPDKPLRFVFAGKAHPNDKPGQDLIKRIIEISKMPQFIGKIIFLENYDMHVGRHLVSGVDIWLNTPTRPLEASGTSGEKAVMNGVLNLSVLDGWWAEGYKPNAGWAIQEAKTYANQAFQDELDAEIIYQLIEDEILPVYFDRDKQGVSHKWVGYIKNNFSEIAPHFTMKRMLDDYYNLFYNKLFDRNKQMRKDDFKLAYELESWKTHIRENWNHIKILSVRLPNSSLRPLTLGETFEVELEIDTNGIEPDQIGIEMVIGQKVMDKVDHIHRLVDLKLKDTEEGHSRYVCDMDLIESGVYDFAFRIYPKNEKLPHRQDFPLVKWI
ncbi:MAG: alpha-glucan family phosphorylase [Bacteroidetes bacterium]|nr:alpha-glucan family phosphorylase [Bacteroidota bacterium]